MNAIVATRWKSGTIFNDCCRGVLLLTAHNCLMLPFNETSIGTNLPGIDLVTQHHRDGIGAPLNAGFGRDATQVQSLGNLFNAPTMLGEPVKNLMNTS